MVLARAATAFKTRLIIATEIVLSTYLPHDQPDRGK
jgi:hypothetical protein